MGDIEKAPSAYDIEPIDSWVITSLAPTMRESDQLIRPSSGPSPDEGSAKGRTGT
jgi:hypothetical protein